MNFKITNENIAGVNFCTLDLPDTIELLAEWSGGKAKDLNAKGENLKVEGDGARGVEQPPTQRGLRPGGEAEGEDLKAKGERLKAEGAERRSEAGASVDGVPEVGDQKSEGTPTGEQLNYSTTQPNSPSAFSHSSSADVGRPRCFACVNAHSVETAHRDGDFREALDQMDMITPDGAGIVLASRLLGGTIRERVCGPDVFVKLCEHLNQKQPGTRMFFLGTNDATLEVLQKKFTQTYPELVFAGAYAPPYRKVFSESDTAEMVDKINNSKAAVLWIGLGAPKQEKWCSLNRNRLDVNLIAPVGGVFDFFTGQIKLPPRWAQNLGLIGPWRLIQQPRRLLRRNLDSPLFLLRVLKQRFNRS